MISLLFVTLAFASSDPFFQDLDAFRAKNPNLKTELSRVEAASARALSRALHWTPEINLNASRNRTTSRSFDEKTVSDSNSWGVSANFSLFRGGADLFASSAANANKEAQLQQFEAEVLSLENRVSKLLFQNLFLKENLSIQRSLLQLKEDSLRIGKERFSQGKIPLQEVTKLELDISQQRNRVRQTELEVESNLVALRSLFVDETKTKEWPFTVTTKLALNDSDASPTIKGLQLRADSAKKSYWAAKLSHAPSIDLNLRYQESPIRTRESKEWLGSIDLTFPIWSKYSTSASVAEANTILQESESAALLREKEEVLQKGLIQKKLDTFSKNLQENTANLEKSEKLYRDMLRSFQLGRISVNDLFLEQNRRYDSVLSYVESKMAFHEGVMDACSAWGKRARDCVISSK